MKFCGHILVRRGDSSGGADALSEATERLEDGSDVLLFPEGTRSKNMGVGAFHAGAFALAVHADATLAPILIFCSRPVLKRGAPWYAIPPQTVTLELKTLGYLEPLEDEPINRLKERAHQLFQASLQSPPSLAP
jgi:1-acyl-sn-glycerol-3-phosphate acyltransferase